MRLRIAAMDVLDRSIRSGAGSGAFSNRLKNIGFIAFALNALLKRSLTRRA